MLGCDINEGNIIAYPNGNSMCLGEIIAIHPKMISIRVLPDLYNTIKLIYPRNAVLVSKADAMAYIMRGQTE